MKKTKTMKRVTKKAKREALAAVIELERHEFSMKAMRLHGEKIPAIEKAIAKAQAKVKAKGIGGLKWIATDFTNNWRHNRVPRHDRFAGLVRSLAAWKKKSQSVFGIDKVMESLRAVTDVEALEVTQGFVGTGTIEPGVVFDYSPAPKGWPTKNYIATAALGTDGMWSVDAWGDTIRSRDLAKVVVAFWAQSMLDLDEGFGEFHDSRP